MVWGAQSHDSTLGDVSGGTSQQLHKTHCDLQARCDLAVQWELGISVHLEN